MPTRPNRSPASPDEARLLADLVAIPSESGDEAGIAAFVVETARGWGLTARATDAGVSVEVTGGAAGPTLAFASHLDVVPPGEGWSRDPWEPTIEGGRLYGRGSGDAKASVAAMLAAAFDLAAAGAPERGRLLVLLGFSEETADTTMGRLLEANVPVDAAVVGEPTNLDLAVAQRGLLRVDLLARGDQRHAGRVGEGPFDHAIEILAEDLLALREVAGGRPHPLLGEATVTPTLLEAGVSRNVTPPTARAALDIRSTPHWSHPELVEAVRAAVVSEVHVVSDHLVPCQTPAGSALLDAARRTRPEAREYGSPTCSDWVFLRHLDAVKCGPGASQRSHTADEWVELAEVAAARGFYAAVARAYLAGGAG